MKSDRCQYHDALVGDIAEVKTDIKWLVKREEEKQAEWEKRSDRGYNNFWKVVGVLFLAGTMVIAYLELFQ